MGHRERIAPQPSAATSRTTRPVRRDHKARDSVPIEIQDVDVISVLLPDISGLVRGKWLPGDSLPKILSDGVAFPLSLFGLDIWGREVAETELHLETGDTDGIARAIPRTLRRTPWSQRPSAQVLLTMYERDGTPWAMDPRHVLAAQIERLARHGLTACCAFEMEFYLWPRGTVAPGQPPVAARHPGEGPVVQAMYDMAVLEERAVFLHAVRDAARALELPADSVITEASPDQFEVNLLHRADALAAADDAVLLRHMIQNLARANGLIASFMAKPLLDLAGSGMHVHVSLLDREGKNAFGQTGEEGDRLLRRVMGGLLGSMPDLTLPFIQSYNGFRRMCPGHYAPNAITWGEDNRTVAVRIPNGPPKARRFEHRVSGADANPHLVLAAILAGVLEGLEQDLPVPEPVRGNGYEQDSAIITAEMDAAIRSFERSDLVARAFGAQFRKVYAEVRRAELKAFQDYVSPLEYRTYL